MTQNEAKEKYIELLMKAEKATGRKEAVKLIRTADKVRMKLSNENKTN